MSDDSPEMIYFMGSLTDIGELRAVKIGRSRDPRERLRQFQTGNPDSLRLLAVTMDTSSLPSYRDASGRPLRGHPAEAAFHEWFSSSGHFHVGEWFEPEAILYHMARHPWEFAFAEPSLPSLLLRLLADDSHLRTIDFDSEMKPLLLLNDAAE